MGGNSLTHRHGKTGSSKGRKENGKGRQKVLQGRRGRGELGGVVMSSQRVCRKEKAGKDLMFLQMGTVSGGRHKEGGVGRVLRPPTAGRHSPTHLGRHCRQWWGQWQWHGEPAGRHGRGEWWKVAAIPGRWKGTSQGERGRGHGEEIVGKRWYGVGVGHTQMGWG